MAFEWIPIEVGDIIRKSHIEEIRDNIDSIKDNLAYVSEHSGVKNGEHTNEKTSEYDTYQGSNYPSNKGDRITEYNNQYSDDESSNWHEVKNNEKNTNYDGDQTGVQSWYCSGVWSSD